MSSACVLTLFTLTIHSVIQIFVESYMPEMACCCSLNVFVYYVTCAHCAFLAMKTEFGHIVTYFNTNDE